MTILFCLLSLLFLQQPVQPELGTISGQLRTTSGSPVPGFRVFAIPVEDGGAVNTLNSIALADNQGHYRLEGVPPGRYLIATGQVASPTYYPGVTNRNQGRILTVTAGQAIADIDFSISFLTIPPQVWGRVEFDDGSPLPVGTLSAVQLILSSAGVHWITRPFTNQQGLFFFQPIVPGEYSVSLAPLPLGYGYVKSMTFGNVDLTRNPIVLKELNATEIRVVLTRTRPSEISPGVKVSGHVTSIVPLVLNSVTRVSDQAHPEDVINVAASITPRDDGFFEIEGVPPGRYTLGPRGSKGSISLDVAASDITRADLDLSLVTGARGARGTPIRLPIVLSANSTKSITGTIEVDQGAIPAFELVFPTTRAGQSVITTRISAKEFTVNLPEGEYRINVVGLPDGYAVESVTAGPLDLAYPFLVSSRGIADRFTGAPVLARSAGTSTVSAGIVVRLKAPKSEK